MEHTLQNCHIQRKPLSSGYVDSSTKINMKVDRDHYLNEDYDVKGRFVSYWHQIYEVKALNPGEILEIGVGNKFLSKYLRNRDFKITTLDIEADLYPNVVGNILAIPFLEESFDVVTCFELLEHLPYSYFKEGLKELHRVSKLHVLMSLPDVTAVYRFYIELPRIKPIKKMIAHPFPRTSVHIFNGHHYWEIGKKNYPLRKIEQDIKHTGFTIRDTYRVFEFCYHRFFLLSK